MSKQVLKLEKIRIDGGTQARAKISEETVADYAERIQSKDDFPSPVVFFDGAEHWLADGFHRYHSLRRLERKSAEFEIRKGTQRDAILFAAAANVHHGLRRTNADKRKAVGMLLADPEWAGKSNRWIADQCCVGDDLVAEVRDSTVGNDSSNGKDAHDSAETTVATKRVGMDGKSRSVEPSKPKQEKTSESNSTAKAAETEPAAPVADDTPEPEEPAKVPKKFAPVFGDQAEFRSIVQQLGKTLSAIEELAAKPSGVFLNEAFERIKAEIGNAQREVKFAMPHQVCPYCKGAGCKPTVASKSPCRQTGWTVKGVKGPGE